MKTCKRCGVEQELSEFRQRTYPNGKTYYESPCRLCLNKYQNEYRKSPEGFKKRRDYNLMYVYSMTPERFEEMVEEQDGVCAICPSTLNLNNREYAVDHDHSCCSGRRSCGKCVRAILCSDCNKGLGYFKDNPEVLEIAALYIRHHQELKEVEEFFDVVAPLMNGEGA